MLGRLAVLSLLATSALSLPHQRRDYGADDGAGYYDSAPASGVSVTDNIDVNVNGQQPSPNSTTVSTSSSGSDANVNVNASGDGYDVNVNVDTHIEYDSNGNECEVNAAGVTIRVNINGNWLYYNTPTASLPTFYPPPESSYYPEPTTTSSSSPVPPPYSSTPSSSTSTPISTPISFTTTVAPTTIVTTTTATTATTTTSTSPAPSNFISGVGVRGISWDTFTVDDSCKTPAEIAADITQLVSYGYASIRLYGVDCNAVYNALNTLQTLNAGATLIVGVYSTTNYTAETADLITQINNRWDYISYVSVFNEAVNDGRATVAQVATAVSYVKSQVPSGVSVTTIDTFAAFISNPDLCNVGQDFIAANCQPYFSAVYAQDAGSYVYEQQANVASVCSVPQSSVQMTESGWPSAGNVNGNAVPSEANKYIAVRSIISAMNGEVIVFEAFNDYWKAPGPYGVENSFGLYISSSP